MKGDRICCTTRLHNMAARGEEIVYLDPAYHRRGPIPVGRVLEWPESMFISAFYRGMWEWIPGRKAKKETP
jgi:hypothetical protein